MLLLGLLLSTATASAQSAASAVLFPPQTESFPRIRTYLDIHDAQGAFIHGVQASEVTILENGRPLQPAEFSELRPGVQIVFALNPGAPLSVRNSRGVSRYGAITNALSDWAKSRRGTSIDDLSLLVAAGPELTHFSDSFELVSALESFQPNLDISQPGLEVLLRAIDLAADATPRPGMERAVVLVTPPVGGDISFSLQELISRAQPLRVHVSVWLVASPQAFDSQPARLLAGLAEQTGGQFFTFSGVEAIPNLEVYFEQLRNIYQLAYDSAITQSGDQELAVEIHHGDQVITSPVLPFSFDLKPPDPAFISPPMEILRALPGGRRASLWAPANPADLLPREEKLQVLVDFPDGRARPLARTVLYVDGALVQENTKPPFERFTWDVSAYTTSGQHLLQVEAVDSLGLQGSSIQVPVQVQVNLPASAPVSGLLRRWPILAGLAAALAGAGVLLALILAGRIQPGLMAPLRLGRGRFARKQGPSQPSQTQGERPRGEGGGRHLPEWVNRLQWPQRRLHPKAYAYLTYLPDAGGRPGAAPIPITTDELTFGLDPSQATLVLSDPSVEGLHARLLRREDGSFLLVDQGSVAGTWVNFAEVSSEGQPLEHGDLIHIGRVGFRFTQPQPQHARKPVITLEEPPL